MTMHIHNAHVEAWVRYNQTGAFTAAFFAWIGHRTRTLVGQEGWWIQ